MRLYLMRHAAYNPVYIDHEEGLSTEGQKQIQKQALYLKNKRSVIRKIITSPKKRALQTAYELAHDLSLNKDEIEIEEFLTPSSCVEQALAWMEEHFINHMLWVSHLPLIEDIVFQLTKASVPFSPGTIVKISFNDLDLKQGKVEWVSSPKD